MPISPIVSIDSLERSKLKILYAERFYAHLFCFGLAFVAGLVAWDVGFLTHDLWEYLTNAPGPTVAHYYYLGHSWKYLMIQLITPYVFVALALFLGLVNTRATTQLSSKSRRMGKIGAGVLVLAGLGLFVTFLFAESGRPERFLATVTPLLSIPFANWISVAELAVLISVTVVLNSKISIRALTQMPDSDALVLRENPDKGFRDRLFRTSLGVPRIIDYLPSRQFAAATMFVLANALYAISSFFFVIAMMIIFVHWTDALESCGVGFDACLSSKAQFYFAISLVTALVALIIAPLVGGALTQRAQRHVRLSLAELLARDGRAPILFLRPFADDQVHLRAARIFFLGRIGQWLAPLRTLDTLLLDEATPYGPVVAIGNPNDKFPPYGAARGFFTHQSWQSAVSGLAERSRAIIICVDDFEGVWWEIENVAARHLDKTLILIHPRHAGLPSGRELLNQIAQRMSRDPVGAKFSHHLVEHSAEGPLQYRLMGTFVSIDGAPRMAQSETFSQLAYLLTVRLFLRSKWGLASGAA